MQINRLFIKPGFALISFCFFISLNLKAQEMTFAPSHLKAAEDMLISMHVPGQITGLFNLELNNSLEMEKLYHIQPHLHKEFIKAITAYFAKYGNWELIKNDLIKIYAAEFSETEIKELTKFYSTPLGQKMLKKQPMLMQKSMDIGRQAVASHQDELMKDLIKLEAEKN